MSPVSVSLRLFCVLLSLSLATIAFGFETRAGGSVRSFVVLEEDGGRSQWEALSRMRVKLNLSRGSSVSGEIAYELIPRLRERGGTPGVSTLTGIAFPSYRAIDLDETLYPGDGGERNFVLDQNLDRAVASFHWSRLDLLLGRQPVSFGSARAVNPTDAIAPFSQWTIATEERPGVDAIRVRAPAGSLGELDAGVVFGENFRAKKSAAFLRRRWYVEKADVVLTAMAFRENYLLGLDMARAVGGAGAWLEAAHVLVKNGGGDDYLRLSAGMDYSFTAKLYAFAEYHYSGPGSEHPEKYLDDLETFPFTGGGVYLLGRHYLAPGVSYQLSPLLVFAAEAMVNLSDGSALVSPSGRYSLADNASLGIGAVIAIGRSSGPDGIPESEFGLYPNLYHVSLSVYF